MTKQRVPIARPAPARGRTGGCRTGSSVPDEIGCILTPDHRQGSGGRFCGINIHRGSLPIAVIVCVIICLIVCIAGYESFQIRHQQFAKRHVVSLLKNIRIAGLAEDVQQSFLILQSRNRRLRETSQARVLQPNALVRHHYIDPNWRGAIDAGYVCVNWAKRCTGCQGSGAAASFHVSGRGLSGVDEPMSDRARRIEFYNNVRGFLKPEPGPLIQVVLVDAGIQRLLAARQILFHGIGSTLLLRNQPFNLRASLHGACSHRLQRCIGGFGSARGSIGTGFSFLKGTVHDVRLICVDSNGKRPNHNKQTIKKQLAALVLIVLLFPLAVACVRLGEWTFQKEGAAFVGGIGGMIVILVAGQCLVYCSLRMLIG